ncbi:hypothetical protein IWQ57_000280 [Coemansia nantahalensis]|uniref:Uncharacterized protein n=1 Tax=Coemansia nantahalensis TaxID=2789366 RepID=A0ACC1K929_9FUNG|nr:hypothetical protein IWQ57_000280 [Coemansia nantahalensis]
MAHHATPAYAAGLARDNAFNASSTTELVLKRSWVPVVSLRSAVLTTIWVAIQLTVVIAAIAKGATDSTALAGYNRGVQTAIMACISLNFLLMSPTLLRILRETPLRRIVPFDKAVQAHKYVSYTMLFWLVQHVISRYYTFYKAANGSKGKLTWATLLFGMKTGQIGHAMVAVLVVMLLAALPVVRRRWYEVFYLLHHLSFALVILMFLHVKATTFQYYIAAPGAIYVVDRIYRAVRGRFNQPRILSVIKHSANVIELRIERNGLKYRAGQYVYLCCPSLSWHQWHPFTLTSAPEEGELSVHIRIHGGWTKRLVQRLQQCAPVAPPRQRVNHSPARPDPRQQAKRTDSVDSNQTLTPSYDIRSQRPPMRGPQPPPGARTGPPRAPRTPLDPARVGGARAPRGPRRNIQYPPEAEYYAPGSNTPYTRAERGVNRVFNVQPQAKLPTIMVDGPYCAATQDVFNYDHIVLICGNIGATPMSAVLKSLYYRLTAPKPTTTVRKVYFIWACRDVQSLEWFRDLLAALDMEDIGDILEIRTYLTGPMRVDQIRNIALHQDPDGADAVTGLYRSPTYYGRPNFDRVLGEIGHRCPATDVGVFFCGSKKLGRELRQTAHKWSRELRPRKTKFVFHEEMTTL